MDGLVLRSRRRLIERPRLLRALDRSTSNLRTIVASAGYGKTTLAEQWSAVEGRRVGWYRARTSASDVSVVARGLAEAAARIVPDAGRRMLERLAVTSDPDREARLLAEMLASDLQDWPSDGWIVIDDFHFVQAAPDPETFVETLLANAPVQLLLVGRNRPRWVSARDVLYGDVLEIGRAALAMNADEIDEMLGENGAALAPGLLAVADGWPAVVALSAAAARSDLPATTDVPEELFDFFAEEVFRTLDKRLRGSLVLLAQVPVITRETAAIVLGEEQATRTCSAALDMGLLDVSDGGLVLHPLAVSFLVEREISLAPLSAPIARELTDHYRMHDEWDAAFQLVRQFGTNPDMTQLLEAGTASMLRSGRLGTLERWLRTASEAGVTSPLLGVAEAEVELRHGRHTTALTILEPYLPNDGPTSVRFRAMTLAARAAHIAAREEDALAYFDAAMVMASTREERRIALEGKLMCAATLELGSASELLSTLEAHVDRACPEDVVRLADRRLSFSYRFGSNDVLDAVPYVELVSRMHDPVAAVSFLNLVAWGLVLASDYPRALELADRAAEHCLEYRVDLALPWVRGTKAMALGGLKKYDVAHAEVECARRRAIEFSDLNGVQNAYALTLRLLVQEGRAIEASSLEAPSMQHALPFMKGEVHASRALAFAAAGRFRESEAAQLDALSASGGVETKILVAAAAATCASRSRDGTQIEKCERLLRQAFECNTTDPVITALRGCPDLLETMSSTVAMQERAVHALRRSGDEAMLSEAGASSLVQLLNPVMTLSAREREVYALVCQGLSNAAIAKELFVAESTVKSHIHRMYDKLGIRSRAGLVAAAATSRQAASAAGTPADATKS